MLYQLIASPTIEMHSENLMRLFVRDALGAPVSDAHVKVWAGPPPSGTPPYFIDDVPYRKTMPSGMLEYFAVAGTMPDTRDYWMQILANDGTLQSDPIQFHFPKGSTIWIIATVQATNSTPPADGQPPTPSDVNWDARLTDMCISIAPVAGLSAGQAYWKIISAQYQDETQSGGNHNLYYTVLDERGMAAAGVPVVIDWQGREPNDIPTPRYSDGNGTNNFGLYAGSQTWDPKSGPGPYTGWVGDPDLRGRNGTGIPGEKFVGAGLPVNRHVNFIVTWRKAVYGTSPQLNPPSNSSVTGKIQGAASGAQLSLASGVQTLTTHLDATGNYAFSQLAAGTYALSLAGAGVINPSIVLDGNNSVVVNYTVQPPPSGKPIFHYLLFGSPNLAATRTNVILALDYVARFAPTVGFGVNEAKSAQNVTIVGTGALSAADEQALTAAGCTVRHIAGADSYAVQQSFDQLIAAANPFPSA